MAAIVCFAPPEHTNQVPGMTLHCVKSVRARVSPRTLGPRVPAQPQDPSSPRGSAYARAIRARTLQSATMKQFAKRVHRVTLAPAAVLLPSLVRSGRRTHPSTQTPPTRARCASRGLLPTRLDRTRVSLAPQGTRVPPPTQPHKSARPAASPRAGTSVVQTAQADGTTRSKAPIRAHRALQGRRVPTLPARRYPVHPQRIPLGTPKRAATVPPASHARPALWSPFRALQVPSHGTVKLLAAHALRVPSAPLWMRSPSSALLAHTVSAGSSGAESVPWGDMRARPSPTDVLFAPRGAAARTWTRHPKSAPRANSALRDKPSASGAQVATTPPTKGRARAMSARRAFRAETLR